MDAGWGLDPRLAEALTLARVLALSREPTVRRAAERIYALLRDYAEEEIALSALS